jgi:hypothetical protein
VSEFFSDWRFTANQFVLAPSPLRLTARICFSHLNTCGHSPYITSSVTKGWVCHLQLLLVLASSFILGSESRGTHDHILLSQIWDFPFRRLLRIAGLRWKYWTPPPHGVKSKSKSKSKASYVTTDGHSAIVSWCQELIWGLKPDFYYCQTVAGFWCGALSLTRERVCLLQLLPVLASAVIHGPSPAGLVTNLYLSILLHYFTYNYAITVTMQPNKPICMFSLLLSLCVSASVAHHQVLYPMPKLLDYIVLFLFLVLLSTSHTAVPLYWHWKAHHAIKEISTHAEEGNKSRRDKRNKTNKTSGT